jgi:hypothetical protein
LPFGEKFAILARTLITGRPSLDPLRPGVVSAGTAFLIAAGIECRDLSAGWRKP